MAKAQVNGTLNKVQSSKTKSAALRRRAIREIANPKDGTIRRTVKSHETGLQPRRQDKENPNRHGTKTEGTVIHHHRLSAWRGILPGGVSPVGSRVWELPAACRSCLSDDWISENRSSTFFSILSCLDSILSKRSTADSRHSFGPQVQSDWKE